MHFEILSVAIARAKADANIASIVGSKVFNYVPKDEAPPYLRVQVVEAEEIEEKSDSLFSRVTLRFDFWTESFGDKEVLEMIDYITAEFNKSPLVLTGGPTNINILRSNSVAFLEGDGLSRHGVVDFSLLMEG